MEKKNLGRPKLDEDEKRNILYRFRLTKEEHDKLFSVSKSIRMPVSEILREALSDWYRKR